MTRSQRRRGAIWGGVATAFLLLVNAILLWSAHPRFVSRATIRLLGFNPHPHTEKETDDLIYRFVEDFADSFVSEKTIEVTRLNLALSSEGDPTLKYRIRASPVTGSTFVSLSAWDESPLQAQRIVTAVLDARAQIYDETARERLDEEASATDVVAAKVVSQLSEVLQNLAENAYRPDYAANTIEVNKSLFDVVVQKAKLRAVIESLGAMAKLGVLGEIRHEPEATGYLTTPETLRTWSAIEMKRELALAQTALAQSSANFGENSPKTKVARARLDAAQKELQSFLQLQIQKERLALAALEKSEEDLERIRATYEQAMAEAKKTVLAEGTQRALKSGLETALAEIVKSRQLIALSKASAQPLFMIETPPALPSARERPLTRLGWLACPLLGAIIGLLGTLPNRWGA